MDRFNDNPKYLVKGEQLKFDMGDKTLSSGKKKSINRIYQDPNRSQSSLQAHDAPIAAARNLTRAPQTPENFRISNQNTNAFLSQRRNNPDSTTNFLH